MLFNKNKYDCVVLNINNKYRKNSNIKIHNIIKDDYNNIYICECCKRRILFLNIDDIKKDTIYIKLPKENYYTYIQHWLLYYTKSQIKELLYIAKLIGLNKIRIEYENIYENLLILKEFDIKIIKENHNKIIGEKEIDNPIGFKIDNKYIYQDDNIYYLKKNDIWKKKILLYAFSKKKIEFIINNKEILKFYNKMTKYQNIKIFSPNIEIKIIYNI